MGLSLNIGILPVLILLYNIASQNIKVLYLDLNIGKKIHVFSTKVYLFVFGPPNI